MSRHARAAHPRHRSRVVLASTGLLTCLLAVGTVATTTAAFRDDAYLRMDEFTSGFQVGAIDTATDTVHGLSATGSTFALRVPEAARGTYVPGTTAHASIPVFNNSPTLAAGLALVLAAVPEADPAVADAVRVSARVRYHDGQALDLLGTPEAPATGGVGLADATAALSRPLGPREAAPLVDGAPFAPGADASSATVEVWLYLAPTEELRGRANGSAAVTVTIEGSSA